VLIIHCNVHEQADSDMYHDLRLNFRASSTGSTRKTSLNSVPITLLILAGMKFRNVTKCCTALDIGTLANFFDSPDRHLPALWPPAWSCRGVGRNGRLVFGGVVGLVGLAPALQWPPRLLVHREGPGALLCHELLVQLEV
jgi:hypothetical protein